AITIGSFQHHFRLTHARRQSVQRSGGQMSVAARSGSGHIGQPMEHKSSVAGARLVQALVVRSQPVAGTEDRTLFNRGETPTGLYFLQSGEAALLMKSHTGQTVMCRHARSGSLLGLPGIIGNEPYTLIAILRKGS